MSEFSLLLCCSLATLGLLIAELILGHFSHCLTLLTVTNQTIYNLMTLVFALMAKKVRVAPELCIKEISTSTFNHKERAREIYR